jgi:hypothetical protein
MVRVSLYTILVGYMRVTGLKISAMVEASNSFCLEIHIRGNSVMEKHMEKVSTPG